MSDAHFGERVKQLLAQDPHINELQTKEFRMQLETSLVSWEEKSARVRRALLVAVSVFFGCYLVGFAGVFLSRGLSLANPGAAAPAVLPFVAGAFYILGILSFVIGLYLLLLYLFKYAPALKKARFDVQTAMILELQEQMVQMRQELRSSER